MKTNDKTLADVQPGGRVRLGDGPTIEKQARELLAAEHRKCDRNTEADLVLAGDVTVLGQIALNAIIAALSAQPSPGSQGDALLESLVARWRNHAEEIGVSDNLLCQKIANCTMRHAAELQAVLAARQPVGEPVIDYADLVDQAKDLIQCGCSVNGAFDWLLEQLTDGEALAAPPAQAVDLCGVREALQAAEGLATICASVDGYSREEVAASGRAMRQQFADALAKVDSQAVGNG